MCALLAVPYQVKAESRCAKTTCGERSQTIGGDTEMQLWSVDNLDMQVLVSIIFYVIATQ